MAKKTKKTVFLARVEHKHGDTQAVFSTESKAGDFVLSYVRQSLGDLPAMLGRECEELVKTKKKWDAISLYFDYMTNRGVEFYSIQEFGIDAECS